MRRRRPARPRHGRAAGAMDAGRRVVRLHLRTRGRRCTCSRRSTSRPTTPARTRWAPTTRSPGGTTTTAAAPGTRRMGHTDRELLGAALPAAPPRRDRVRGSAVPAPPPPHRDRLTHHRGHARPGARRRARGDCACGAGSGSTRRRTSHRASLRFAGRHRNGGDSPHPLPRARLALRRRHRRRDGSDEVGVPSRCAPADLAPGHARGRRPARI